MEQETTEAERLVSEMRRHLLDIAKGVRTDQPTWMALYQAFCAADELLHTASEEDID